MWMYILILAVSGSSLVSAVNYTHATRTSLANHLLTGYDVKARPEAFVNVSAQLVFTHMNGLDTINQILDVAGGVLLMWSDPRLVYDTSVYNMDYLHVARDDLWVPPIAIYNAAEGRQIFNDNDDTQNEVLIVYPTGDVAWPHSLRIRSQCDVNIRFYPFDNQVCEITMIPWAYLETEVAMTPMTDKVDVDAYAENGEWDLLKTTSRLNPLLVSGGTYGTLKFEIYLQRKQSYYVLNILLPVVFLAFLGPTVFVLPVESGEKAGFALTILLSLSVVMTIVSDQIPSTSTHVAGLSVYLLVTYIVCVLEVLVTTFTIRLHNFDGLGYNVPPRINRLIHSCLAPLVCYRRGTDKEKKEPQKVNKNKVGVKNDFDKIKKNSIITITNDPNWSADIDDREEEEEEVVEYSYEELCVMLDSFNLYLFEGVTVLITVISFLVISVGGSQ